MIKYLAILLWPAGVGAILAAGALLARRDPAAMVGSRHGSSRLLGWTARHAGSRWLWRRLITVGLVLVAGLAVTYLVTALAGLLIVHSGHVIDQPLFRWLAGHRSHKWSKVMSETTQFGYKWTTWGAAAAAGVCLAFIWREHRWVPPVALGSLIVIDHFLVRVLTVTFHRVPPPGTGGTFPSGGCDRVIVFYGLIAYMLWREVSGRRGAAIWAAAVVAALGFNESYSRTYLGLHWFTDTLGGLLCGGLELVAFVLAVQAVAGRRRDRIAPIPGTSATPTSILGPTGRAAARHAVPDQP
jgi:membrane-associated phospholipid phosphatase